MYLLDTNHCSLLLDGHSGVAERLRRLDGAQVATCVIVQGELLYMVHHSTRETPNRSALDVFLRTVQILSIDDETADHYGRIKAALFRRFGPREKAKLRRTSLGQLGFTDNDLWIAAIAQRNGLIVVSSDGDFARIAEATPLAHESWLTSDPQ